MARSGGRLRLLRQPHVGIANEDPADHKTVCVGVIEHDLSLAEKAVDQIAIAKLVVGNALHHVGMGCVIIAFEHLRVAPFQAARDCGWSSRAARRTRPYASSSPSSAASQSWRRCSAP